MRSAAAICTALLALAALTAVRAAGDDAPSGNAAPPRTPDADRWVALDISAAMEYDAVCTPNELLVCCQSYRRDAADGDTDGDLHGSQIDRSHRPHSEFGHHRLGAHWTSLSLSVAGGVYPHVFDDSASPAGPDGGVPPDGRVGIYRLYVDELEHPDWAQSGPGHGRRGRNAIYVGGGPKDDMRVEVPLPASQRGHYRSLNLLFAGSEYSVYGKNDVRISARYADGTEQSLWQGRMGNLRGDAVIGWSREQYRTLPGQREGLDMKQSVDAWSNGAGLRGPGRHGGDLALLEFERPLRLDPRRELAALIFDRDDDVEQIDYWKVWVFAASALPAE